MALALDKGWGFLLYLVIMKALAVVGALTLVVYQYLKLIHTLVRRKQIAHGTGLLDLPLLAAPRKDGKKIGGTALVCGGR